MSIPDYLYYCPQCKKVVEVAYYNSPLLQKEFKCCSLCRSVETVEYKRTGVKK